MTDAEKQASPAPLDVPRLETLLRQAAETLFDKLARRTPGGNGDSDDVRQLNALAAALSGLVEDRALLDALEREALREPLLLHDGKVDTRGFRGLGLRPGTMVRSLREAVRPFLSPAAPDLREDASEPTPNENEHGR